ncbi:MAG: hypothetical protein JSR25_14195 [Proteobacteria bacterium]|nr:hypothetical protein [Pseudomonadota bacterium]
MKAFSFHIDPSARFEGPRRRIRRSRLDRALQLRLPASKTKAPEPKTQPRRPPPKFLNSDREILAARQTRYRTFVISTMQRSDGSWTASLGRADNGPLIIDGKTQAVMTTGSYRAEFLALAEAQIRIDMRQGW